VYRIENETSPSSSFRLLTGELYLFYKARQIFHTYLANLFDSIQVLLLVVAQAIAITTLYCLIAFRQHLNLAVNVFLVICALDATVITYFFIRECGKTSETSSDFRLCMHKYRAATVSDKISLRAIGIIQYKIANIHITRHTFPYLMQEIVVGTLTNLLIAF